MPSGGLVLVGVPDSGKTNYLARLWAAFREDGGTLRSEHLPEDISYIEQGLSCLLQGKFAPRTGVGADQGDRVFSVMVGQRGSEGSMELTMPDVSGELWREAIETYEVPDEWMRTLENAVGALLFVRVGSDQNAEQLDWVTASGLLAADVRGDERQVMPTAVQLCELVRFLDFALCKAHDNRRGRVAIMVTAWDLVNSEEAEAGPRVFLEKEFPLFGGRIRESERVDIGVFGVSVVGGDLDADPSFRRRFLERGDIDGCGVVVAERDGKIHETKDLTTPVEWVLSGK